MKEEGSGSALFTEEGRRPLSFEILNHARRTVHPAKPLQALLLSQAGGEKSTQVSVNVMSSSECIFFDFP